MVLAGLLNALGVIGKKINSFRIALIGMGAANFPIYRMLKSSGGGNRGSGPEGRRCTERKDIRAGPKRSQ